MLAQGLRLPGSVPKIYCSFSPSALTMWLSASYSMAMEAMIIVSASSFVISAPQGGKEGIDIAYDSNHRSGKRRMYGAYSAPPVYCMRPAPCWRLSNGGTCRAAGA